jgi:AmmeMemoRadiSam system protein B/AmmeMemoRadiSam system protein A
MNAIRRSVFLVVLSSLACAVGAGGQAPTEVREPVGPGQFYPRDAATLKAALAAMLQDAVPARPETPVAIVVPHAGYVYSGQIAADAFRQVAGRNYETVVILGVNHTDPGFDRVGVYAGAGFRTPLGVAQVDKALVDALLKEDRDAVVNHQVHAKEHSVEVQVPFVQHLFPRAKIVPIVMATEDPGTCERLGRALGRLIKGRPILIVASSDLSHYPAADTARSADARTLAAAASLQPAAFLKATSEVAGAMPANLVTYACGRAAVLVAMHAALELGAKRGVVLAYANSGDTAIGEPDRVVGYGAVAFTTAEGGPDTAALQRPTPTAEPLQASDKKQLLALARESIRRFLLTETVPLPRGFEARALGERGAFVTLKKRGDLRGCIGQIVARGSLPHVVSAMALAAAFEDTRFERVRAEELPQLEIEISVLTPPKTVKGPADIVIGRDGVILTRGGRSAVFLPQVATEQGWQRDELLDNLALKAGLPANAWRQGATFATFQAEVFHEGQFK